MANNATVVGTPTFGAAKFSNGLTATTDSNYLTPPTGAGSPLASSSGSFTVETWLKTSDATNQQIAVVFGTLSAPNNLVIMFVAAGGHLTTYGTASPSGVTIDTGVNIADGNWHHCALVVSGGTSWTVYVDGVKGTTTTVNYTGLTGGSAGLIGRHVVTGSPWNGSIDEVVVWPTAKYSATFTPPAAPYAGTEGMTTLYHLQANGTDSTATNVTIDPSNTAIVYSPFNWSVGSGFARTVNAGAYFRTIFSGTSISLTFDTSVDGSPYPEFWARIDNQGWVKYQLSAGNPTISLATGLFSRKHLVEVAVKSFTTTFADWTAPAMILQLTGILLDLGATVTQPLRRTKNVLVYGDSITAGHLTLGTSPGTEIEDNDSLGSYAFALGTALDAEVGLVGFGGTGISATGDGSTPPLPSTYNFIYSGVSRSFSSPAPDLVIYNEGTNDGTTNITSAYTGVVNAILAAAPSAKQVLLVPFGATFATNQRANIIATVAAVNNPNVTYIDSGGWLSSGDTVDGVHPYGYAGVTLLAPRLFPLLLASLYPTRTFSFF